MLNCGLGVLLLPAAGVGAILKGAELLGSVAPLTEEHPGSLPVVACLILFALASMNDMAAPSVSLEGKNLWLPQSLPVTPWQVLRAKLSLQLILTLIPLLFALACLLTVLPCTVTEGVLVVLDALSFVPMFSTLCLSAGVRMPNLTWTNEVVPVKQSAAVALPLFSGLGYTAALGAVYFLAASPIGAAAFLTLVLALNLVLAALLLLWLKRRGTCLFADL